MLLLYYRRVIGKNPSYFRDFRGASLPVESVTWSEAQAYCKAVGMRLPTEAEWEYAARGGNASSRYGVLAEIAWFTRNSGNRTHDVARELPNGYGLYDMLGNVWEWVEDWGDGAYEPSHKTDPSGAC
jgi:formylglycine-generating enzyme required for sulfatase activity